MKIWVLLVGAALIGCGGGDSGDSGGNVGVGGTAGSVGTGGAAGSIGTGGSTGTAGSGTGGTAGSGSMCTQPGASACDAVIAAMCQRTVQCCSAPGASCLAWTKSITACKAQYLQLGYNCASTMYASKTVCSATTMTCAGDTSLVACTDLMAGTANWPPTCNQFWKQF